MGLYSYVQLDSPAFTTGISDYPQGLTPEGIWSELGFGPYRRSNRPNPKSTDFREPAFRIIHRAIAHGIAGRGDSSVGNVIHHDLLYLHCMVHQTPCQIAECLIRYLFQVRRQKHTQEVFGGGFVRRLASALGVEAPGPIQPGAPQFIATAKAIDFAVLQNMRMVTKDGSTFILREDPRARVDREAGPSGTTGDGGASGSGADQQTAIPEATQIPVSPPVTHVEPPPQPPIAPTVEGDLRADVRRIMEIQRIECARQEQARSILMSALRAFAASVSPSLVIPDLPPPPQVYADFIRDAEPTPTPAADPDQPSSDQPPSP